MSKEQLMKLHQTELYANKDSTWGSNDLFLNFINNQNQAKHPL